MPQNLTSPQIFPVAPFFTPRFLIKPFNRQLGLFPLPSPVSIARRRGRLRQAVVAWESQHADFSGTLLAASALNVLGSEVWRLGARESREFREHGRTIIACAQRPQNAPVMAVASRGFVFLVLTGTTLRPVATLLIVLVKANAHSS